MPAQTLRQIILHNQYLTRSGDMYAVVRDLCGIQAQMHTHSVYTLSVRCNHALPEGWEKQFIKTWTHRGTLHFFAPEDLPLYLHTGRVPRARAVDSLEGDEFITAERKQFFARAMVELLEQGPQPRARLKEFCRAMGMTADEEKSLFNGWGGLLYPLSRLGLCSHVIGTEKSFTLMPPFTPMEEKAAKTEMLSRYFFAYGPATLNDAAYFFKFTKAEIKALMKDIPLETLEVSGRSYYRREGMDKNGPDIPAILLPGGFDPLMLGYKKEESLFLPKEYLRGIFNLAGMVFPPVLVHGQVKGRWKQEKQQVTFTLFGKVNQRDTKALQRKAEETFPGKKIIITL